MRTHTRGWMALFATVALVGCGDPAGLTLGGGDTEQVTVGAGVTPLYTFDGAARRLVVSEVGTGTVAWDIQAADQGTGFLSPVDHGATPQGAIVVTEAAILQGGVRHRVTVTFVEGGDAASEFTP